MNVIACVNRNEEVRLKSSSGGVFSLLAEKVIEKNGIVYGVTMTSDCYSAEFIRVSDIDGLDKLRGSKYLQAKMGNTYKNVKQDVVNEKLVLFSGTGCQINGLKSYLQKEYENLICIDVICHGVPSPELWKRYVQFQEKEHGKLETINFRCKDDSWIDFGMKENQLYISKDKDPYMQMFLRDYCLRPSCYKCVAKEHKKSDITIADFWGIESVAPEMNDGKGTSLVLLRTEKGETLLNEIKECMNIKKVDYESAVRCNPSEYKSVDKPKLRESFFDDMNTMAFTDLSNKYAAPIIIPLKYRVKTVIKQKLKTILKPILKNVKRGGYQETRSNVDYGMLFTFKNDKSK